MISSIAEICSQDEKWSAERTKGLFQQIMPFMQVTKNNDQRAFLWNDSYDTDPGMALSTMGDRE